MEAIALGPVGTCDHAPTAVYTLAERAEELAATHVESSIKSRDCGLGMQLGPQQAVIMHPEQVMVGVVTLTEEVGGHLCVFLVLDKSATRPHRWAATCKATCRTGLERSGGRKGRW